MSVVDDCSFFDFSHNINRTEKRYVVVCVKLFDSTGTYITVKLIKKDNFRDQIQDSKNNCIRVLVSSSSQNCSIFSVCEYFLLGLKRIIWI